LSLAPLVSRLRTAAPWRKPRDQLRRAVPDLMLRMDAAGRYLDVWGDEPGELPLQPGISPRAVEKHVTGIFTKLRLPTGAEDHRRVLAVLTFLRS
jgi:hypothetical protein